jgi:hypothetical protein
VVEELLSQAAWSAFERQPVLGMGKGAATSISAPLAGFKKAKTRRKSNYLKA